MNETTYSRDDLAALLAYGRASTLYQELQGLPEQLKGGTAATGLAIKIQSALQDGAKVRRDLVTSFYGDDAISVGEIQSAVDLALRPQRMSTPFFDRKPFPHFKVRPPYILRE